MKIIYLTGMPASGKLTISNKLKEKLGFAVIDNHKINDIFMDIAEGHHSYTDDVCDCIDAVRDIVLNHIKNGTNINKKGIIFTNVLADDERDSKLYNKIKEVGEKDEFYHIVLKCSIETLISRVGNEDRKTKRKVTKKESLSKIIKNNIQFIPKDKYTYVLENNDSADAIFNKVLEIINK